MWRGGDVVFALLSELSCELLGPKLLTFGCVVCFQTHMISFLFLLSPPYLTENVRPPVLLVAANSYLWSSAVLCTLGSLCSKQLCVCMCVRAALVC